MRKLYAVKDVLAGFVTFPGVPAIIDLPNDQVALRMLKGSCVKGAQPNVLNTNAEDKELWCVGEQDEKTGKITPCEPYLIGRAIEFVEASKDDKSRKDA